MREEQKKNDCSMIVLNEWTPCTLACGGGKKYLQLMQIPAKQGGKECQNTVSIRTRECNNQPCPTVSNMKSITEGNKTSTSILSSATVKMMSISSRPLRYDKCHLKEGDALIEKNDETTKDFSTKPMIPARIVMTDKTIAAYLDDTLISKIIDYNLSQAVIIKKSDGKCFVIQNNLRNDKFCMLDSTKGDFVEEWFYDFNLFKNQCRTDRAKSSLIITEEKKLEKEYKKKLEGVKTSMVEDKASMIKKRVEITEKRKLVTKVDKVRKISITAIEKEQRLEDLLEKEEANMAGNILYIVPPTPTSETSEASTSTPNYSVLCAAFGKGKYDNMLFALTKCGLLLGFEMNPSMISSLQGKWSDYQSGDIKPSLVVKIPGCTSATRLVVNERFMLVNTSDALRLYNLDASRNEEVELTPDYVFQDPVSKAPWIACDFSSDGEYVVVSTSCFFVL